MVRLASVRRSLFTNAVARLKYLSHLMIGTKDILQTGKGKFHPSFGYVGFVKIGLTVATMLLVIR